MNRRGFLGAMVATASGLLVPDPERKRVYSFGENVGRVTPWVDLSSPSLQGFIDAANVLRANSRTIGEIIYEDLTVITFRPMLLNGTLQTWQLKTSTSD